MNVKPVILQVLPALESGGVERGTLEITQAIAKAGMKPLVVSSGGSLVPHVNYMGGEHITMQVATKNPLAIYHNARKLYQLIKTRGVNILHVRSRAPAWSSYYAAKWAGIPLLATFHGVYGTEPFKKTYNRIMLRGDLVIAVSQFVKEHIVNEYKVDPERIRLIPRGVDFSVFDESKAIPERIIALTKSWRLPEENIPVIFCPGRISRIKGQHILIDALSRMKEEQFLCIIAGNDDGHEDYRIELEEQIVANGLAGKVRIANNTAYMNEAYMLSHLVVVPSIKPESFGRVAIEAQAMGKLVVATDHGGARETIVPNETGYLVPPEDPEIMKEAIRYGLARDAATIKAMGDFARHHVHEHFSSQRMKDLTIAVYRELLDRLEQKNEVAAAEPSPTAIQKNDATSEA
jgi:glycosyltransferase involved in cell wall biosynthesis